MSDTENKSGENKKPKRKAVMIYFEQELLAKLDLMCKRRGGRRSAFIQAIIGKALDNGDV